LAGPPYCSIDMPGTMQIPGGKGDKQKPVTENHCLTLSGPVRKAVPAHLPKLCSRLMVREGLNRFAVKKCIIRESLESTRVLILRAPRALK